MARNNTNENWVRTQSDLAGALADGQLLIQAIVYPAFDDGNASALNGLVNTTADRAMGTIELPYVNPDGSPVYLGDPGLGYPPLLYPNLTYHNATSTSAYYATADAGQTLDPRRILINGPLIINATTVLFSATTAVINNTSSTDILGWLTVIVNGSMIMSIRDSQEGLGTTGQVLLVGPGAEDNHFSFDIRKTNGSGVLDNQLIRFILPPSSNPSIQALHSQRSSPLNASAPFSATSFPALVRAWTTNNNDVNNAGSILDTRNEENKRVSVGYAQVSTPLVDWVLLNEQSYDETVEPINHLRDVVLICVFSVTGGLLILSFPLAHYSVAPIRQLRAATRKTVEPYQPDDSQSGYSVSSGNILDQEGDGNYDEHEARKEGFLNAVTKWATRERQHSPQANRGRRTFRIPAKVPERRHFIYDELTDLTTKFNEMSDELAMQYQRLEERVKERTAELEQSKKAAEAANQSKTLFIANISHELKTPLNGILGLAQICMNEDDPAKMRSTIHTIYKSGDLLLHLLTDLLTFSKNQAGKQLSMDEAEFRLSDLSTQLVPTFDRQAREAQINLQVLYTGTNDSLGNSDTNEEKAYGPLGTGRVKDMYLWGDKNRILQVLMNFTSNSLKFTPPQGSVTVRIRCLGISEPQPLSRASSTRKPSLASRKSRGSRASKSSSKKRVRTSDTSLIGGSDSEGDRGPNVRHRMPAKDGKLSINVGSGTTQIDKIVERQRSKSPPPLNTRDLDFVFEVEDTGPGIPEDQQKRIFEPFVQGDLGLSKKYGGTGLGLSICAQLASLMGGELSLDSTLGKGSKFSMRIPLRYISDRPGSLDSGAPGSRANSISEQIMSDKTSTPPPHASHEVNETPKYPDVPRVLGLSQPFVAKEVTPVHLPQNDINIMKKAESEAAKQGRKVRVLVAEDNQINQEVVLRMLKLEDVYDVTIAKDGQEAFDKVRESMEIGQKFHLVFMDVQMPNVDGIQSTRMIRNMGFSAPIVALTAFAEKSNEDECMASGMDYFLAKPIRRPALKQVLKKYCATIPEEEPDTFTPGPVPVLNGEGKTGTVTTTEDTRRESDASAQPSAEDPGSTASTEATRPNDSIAKKRP
ncbi:Histidine kinase osmosensor [Neophaeococcomyces mojaviensis]|uniref:Histidine kinase osmosensor n=1 Tax=Neophaeococcomyces mojaviensis TaxID=3383035 RepID=A0ACC3AGC9_9EURO|nr:Histidine kinase osmosensor [Knufia sp. JES_112]